MPGVIISRERQDCVYIFRCTLVLSLLLAASTASAAEPLVLTCEDAISIALDRSFTVQSYRSQKTATRYSYAYSRAMFKPRLDLSLFAPSFQESVSPIAQADGLPVYNSTGLMQAGGLLKFTYMLPTGGNFALSSELYRENLTSVLALRDYRKLRSRQAYSSLGLSFRQPVFTANTLKENLKETEYQYEQSSARFTRGKMEIIYEVTERFHALYRAEQEREIAAERLKNSEEAHRVAKLKLDTGRIPEGEVLIAEVEMSGNRAALLEVEGSLERERDAFRQFIGLDPAQDIRIEADVRYEDIAVDAQKAVEEALRNRPEIIESEMEIRQQEISVERAGRVKEIKGEISAYYDLTGVSTRETGNTGELFGSSFDNFVDRPPNRGITFTISCPVFDWGRADASIQKEEILLKERNLGIEDTKRTIVREVRDAVRRVGETRSRLAIHGKNEEVARRSYEISRMRFENGDFTSQELAREQERLASARLNHLSALIEYRLALADLTRKTTWDFRANRSYLSAEYFRERE